MRRTTAPVCFSLFVATFSAGTAWPQASQPSTPSANGGPVPIEIYGCNLNEGAGFGDLDALHERYNAVLDRAEITNVAAFMLTPIFHGASDPYDFLYMERWASGAAMGAGHAMKRSDAFQALLSDWGEVIECPSHKYFVGALIAPPAEARNEAEEAPFQMMSCSLKEGRTVIDAAQAISAWAEAEPGAADGSRRAGHAIWLPAAGEEPDADYALQWTILFTSDEAFGASFDALWREGGAQNLSLIEPVMTCTGGDARTFNQSVIRRME